MSEMTETLFSAMRDVCAVHVDPCSMSATFHQDAVDLAAGMLDLLSDCPALDTSNIDPRIPTFFADLGTYHQCRLDALEVTGECTWNPAYLSASGSVSPDYLGLITTLKANQDGGWSTTFTSIKDEFPSWSLTYFNDLLTTLKVQGNVTEDVDAARTLRLVNLDGICLDGE